MSLFFNQLSPFFYAAALLLALSLSGLLTSASQSRQDERGNDNHQVAGPSLLNCISGSRASEERAQCHPVLNSDGGF